jgi:hypothetical protein
MQFRIIPLEERIVLDAAGTQDVLNSYLLEHTSPNDTTTISEPSTSDLTPVDSSQDSSQDLMMDASMTPDSGVHVLVIGSNVTNSDVLAAAAKDPAHVVTYDPATTSLQQLISQIQTVLGGKKADSIAIANDGTIAGQFKLTESITVSMESLNSNTDLAAFWQSLASMVKDNGRIDLLACNVAATAEGVDLVQYLDSLVDTNDHHISFAASSDLTGNTIGANWTLEMGNINAGLIYFDSTNLSQWAADLGNRTAPFLVEDIVAGSGSSSPSNFVDVNGILYFTAG